MNAYIALTRTYLLLTLRDLVLGGIVAAGSNRSTAKEAMHELTLAEAKRTALIGQIDLRLVPNRGELQ